MLVKYVCSVLTIAWLRTFKPITGTRRVRHLNTSAKTLDFRLWTAFSTTICWMIFFLHLIWNEPNGHLYHLTAIMLCYKELLQWKNFSLSSLDNPIQKLPDKLKWARAKAAKVRRFVKMTHVRNWKPCIIFW